MLAGALAVSGCARQLRVDPGPDEFSVLPARALVEPADYGRLPPPEPGASRAEISAFAMAYTAMGGNGAAPARTLGAGAVGQRSGGGFLARLLGGRGTPGVLDPAAEAARLAALGIRIAK